MRLLGILLLAAAFCTTTVTADLMSLATALPSCALECVLSGIEKSPCGLTNQTCICTNPALNLYVEGCVAASCTIKESLTTKNLTSSACGAPIRDRTKVISWTAMLGGMLALLAFGLRLVARLPALGGQFGWDDFVIGVAMLFVIPLACISIPISQAGLGKDIWTLPFKNITRILKLYYFDESLYIASLALTKISILCFYLRVFPRPGFRMAVYIVIGLNLAFLCAFVLVSVFQCKPIYGVWTRWDGEHPAVCNSENAQAWASAIINIILDLTTMFMPLPELYKLSLTTKKRIFVMCMFSLGIFVTLVSILRLHSLVQFANTKNPTWDNVPVGYWSTVEVDVGVICACLPAIRSLLRRALPSIFGGTSHGAGAGYSKNSSFMSRSAGATSRMESARVSSRMKDEDTSHFVPLVDVEHKAGHHAYVSRG